MLKRLRDIREFIFVVLKLGARRLKRLEADVEVLKTAVAPLIEGKQTVSNQTEGPDSALYVALFNAGSRALETERLSGLYEALASRVALLETLINKTDQYRGDSIEASGSKGEEDLPVSRNIAAEFERILARERFRFWEGFGSSKRYVGQLAREYARTVEERDALLNNRDKLLKERQQLIRRTGPARSSDAPTPRFPQELERLYEQISLSVVDVGAQNLTSEGHVYSPLLGMGAARVIGFEPLKEEADRRSKNDQNILMLNHFIGDGDEGTFHVTKFNPASSLLQADREFLSQFVALPSMCDIVSEERIETTRLDDVPEVKECDFLKIDVQGGELAVLRGATRLLERTIVVHSEVEFAPVYKNQPLFSEIDVFLRERAFDLIDLIKPGYAGYSDLLRPMATSRLMWADAVYFKSPEKLATFGPAKLMRAAYIAHVNYEMYDLAARYLRCLDEMMGSDTRKIYGERLCEISSPS